MLNKLLYKIAQSKMPKMSLTEKIAIEAGETWIEKELFSGNPDWTKIREIKFSELNPEEQDFLNHETEELCGLIHDWEITQELKDLNKMTWDFMKSQGFFGLVIPKQYGGKGFSVAAHSAIVMKIASKSLTAAVTVMVPNSLGPAELLYHYGTEDQKNYYLPRLASGQEVPCFGLTSLQGGSDAGAMIDEGVICKGLWEGQEILGIKLNAKKRYITLAPVATLIGLAFKLRDPHNFLNKNQADFKEELGITLALLPRHAKDLESQLKIGTRHIPLNIPFMNGPIEIIDGFIPLDFIIGGKEQAGQGWKMLMECLSIGRSISLPAVAAASGAVCVLGVSAYVQVRQQFKLPIYKFEGIQEKLAEIGAFSYAIEAMRKMTVTAVDSGIKPSVASAIAKYHMTELSRKIINHSMDIHGGKAIILGPDNYLARAYQGIPVSITVEGANILTRNLMIFGQGSVRCHASLLKLFESLGNKDQNQGKKDFNKVIYKFILGFINHIFRTVFQGITAGFFISVPNKNKNYKNKKIKKTYQQLSRLSSNLALASDLSLLVLGGQLKRRERLSARLGDVLSYLYLITSVLKLYESSNANQQEADWPLVNYGIQHFLFEAQEAFYDFYHNFPNRFLGYWLKRRSFFWGKIFSKPSDKLGALVSQSLIESELVKQRFKDLAYLSDGPLGDLVKNCKSLDLEILNKLLAVNDFEKI